jgi:coenzyme PQQ precursor peptide PqqA
VTAVESDVRTVLDWELPDFDVVEWEAPDFEELQCTSEVTMYVARLAD